jgi:hypothetical protein
MYFNTGTWRRVYQPTQIPGCEQEFIGMEAIGTVVVYHGDERSGRAYETLSGTLGMVYNNVIGGMEKISIADKVIAGPRRIPGEAPVSAVRTSTSTAGKTMY